MNITKDFTDLKKELKEKWLVYCERNETWIFNLMDSHRLWVKTQENIEEDLKSFIDANWQTSRPNSDFMIGVVSILSPQICEFIEVIMTATTDRTSIIKSLDLDFDPFLEIERRKFSQNQQATLIPASSELDDIREQIKQNSGETT
ncbi:DUF5331 domain-containing protein [Picosynechococcus sp. PCC 73109]|uniref:DUF5331 domain-containing protein n=1 Tax=Picosynechococcus sp. PCC 73109 TaxID=374982 RepID=UPI00074581FA|nr:DUF5331 domain-containing protein [Picosynechococcus sp. PCC 73109]AMA09921.1 hypothetical protein AWQ23_11675 [Picosynechococcus sp. PCC 73109]